MFKSFLVSFLWILRVYKDQIFPYLVLILIGLISKFKVNYLS